MGNLGWTEILLIFLVILLVFGAKRIPEIARGLGKGIREFKDATSDLKKELVVNEPPPQLERPAAQPYVQAAVPGTQAYGGAPQPAVPQSYGPPAGGAAGPHTPPAPGQEAGFDAPPSPSAPPPGEPPAAPPAEGQHPQS